MIVRTSRELKASYNELTAGDVFIGNLSLKYLKQPMLIDLLQRGIRCLPSPLAQTLNGSKVAQAFILCDWMLPHTRAISRRTDLIEAMKTSDRNDMGPFVTKQDGMHCGHGVRRWETLETLYSFMALDEASYPFVLQPFREGFTDVRVIIVGDYVESYTRSNLYNFRVNLGFGGSGSPYNLDEKKEAFCRSAMQRGGFPFAHLDLMVFENGEYYLSEITLNGGIKGARIGRQELEQKKKDLLEELAGENA